MPKKGLGWSNYRHHGASSTYKGAKIDEQTLQILQIKSSLRVWQTPYVVQSEKWRARAAVKHVIETGQSQLAQFSLSRSTVTRATVSRIGKGRG